MIQKISAYKSSDGTAHSTLEEAQKHEIRKMFIDHPCPDSGSGEWNASDIASHILEFGDKIVDILTMKPNSLPKARKINGGTKQRTKKHIAEQHSLPLNDPPKEAA